MASDRSLVSTFAAVLLAGSLILFGSGCSLAITARDPDRPRDEVPKCDTGKGLVAADGLWGALFGATSIASFSEDSSGAGLAFAGLAALFVASAVRGSNAANGCREDMDTYYASVRDLQRQQVLAREAMQRSAVKTKPSTPAVAQPVPPVQSDAAEPEEPPAHEPAPEYATPRPPAQRPIKKAPPVKAPPRPADPEAEDWSSFWKVLP